MRSCARRRRAAEIIFIALVICCVFFTLRIRRRMSIRLAMGAWRTVTGRREPGPASGRLARAPLLGEEHLAHLLHGLLDLLAELVGDVLLVADLCQHVALL